MITSRTVAALSMATGERRYRGDNACGAGGQGITTIRRQPATAALWPFVATVALGAIYLAVGILGTTRLEE